MTSNHDNKLSLSELISQAEQGDMQAQFALGLYYLPTEIAEEGWEFKGKLFDDYFLASIDGLVINPKIFSAFEAAENNREENDELAFKWFEKAAKQGQMESQYALARCYFEGRGVGKSDKSAFEWVKKSSDQGFSEAHCLLGDLYHNGRGVEKEDKLALECYKKADKAGVKNANSKKQRMLLTGKGIENYDERREAVINLVDDFSNKLRKGGKHLLDILEKECPLKKNDEDPFEGFLEWLDKSSESLTDLLKASSLAAIDNDESSKNSREKLKSEQEKNEALYKALHEKEKEMLSFFTHTMRNALATAPESLRQAIHLLGSDVYEKDTKHYQAINKIAALFSTLSLTDCLIDTFKQSISDPQEFKQSWQKDHTGEATPKWVIASALRQSLNRIIFMSDTTELRKLLNNPETVLIKATRKSFIEEVLPLNIDSQGVDLFYNWTRNHIPAIEVSITDFEELNFGANQVRFSLLFAITSELVLNTLKYWDGEDSIQISWRLGEQDKFVFLVKNHCKTNANSNLAGTHKGLAFIKRLVQLLGQQAQFDCKIEDQLFTAELILNKSLFDGEI